MVEAISSLPFSFNKIAGATLSLITVSSVAYAWKLNQRLQEELAFSTKIRNCRNTLANQCCELIIENKSELKRSTYLLQYTQEQKTLSKTIEEVLKQLTPLEGAPIKAICNRLEEVNRLLDGTFKMIGDKEGVSLQQVAKAAYDHYSACVTHSDTMGSGLSTEERQWLDYRYPNLAVSHSREQGDNQQNAGKNIDEAIIKSVRAVVEWMNEYPAKDTVYSLEAPTLEEIKEIEVSALKPSFSSGHYKEHVNKCRKSLHQLCRALTYPQPIILKDSSLLDPVIQLFDKIDLTPKTSRTFIRLLYLGALISGVGAIAIFIRGSVR